MVKINNAVRIGSLTFATGITCGAVGYATRDTPVLVFAFTVVLSIFFGLLSAEQIEE